MFKFTHSFNFVAFYTGKAFVR